MLSHEGDDTDTPSPREEVVDAVAVHAPVAMPTVLAVASFVGPVEELLVTTVVFPLRVQEPEPEVAEPELPVVEVERLPSVDWALTDVTRTVCIGWTM